MIPYIIHLIRKTTLLFVQKFPKSKPLCLFGTKKKVLSSQQMKFLTIEGEKIYRIPFCLRKNTNALKLILRGAIPVFIFIRLTRFCRIRCTDTPKTIMKDGWNALIPTTKKKTFL